MLYCLTESESNGYLVLLFPTSAAPTPVPTTKKPVVTTLAPNTPKPVVAPEPTPVPSTPKPEFASTDPFIEVQGSMFLAGETSKTITPGDLTVIRMSIAKLTAVELFRVIIVTVKDVDTSRNLSVTSAKFWSSRRFLQSAASVVGEFLVGGYPADADGEGAAAAAELALDGASSEDMVQLFLEQSALLKASDPSISVDLTSVTSASVKETVKVSSVNGESHQFILCVYCTLITQAAKVPICSVSDMSRCVSQALLVAREKFTYSAVLIPITC
jgi:hypothetical protein